MPTWPTTPMDSGSMMFPTQPIQSRLGQVAFLPVRCGSRFLGTTLMLALDRRIFPTMGPRFMILQIQRIPCGAVTLARSLETQVYQEIIYTLPTMPSGFLTSQNLL